MESEATARRPSVRIERHMSRLRFLVFLLDVSALLLIPSGAGAQAIASSFDELRSQLAAGQKVTVTDTAGRQTTGTVTQVAPQSFEVATKRGGNQTFGNGKLTATWRSDRLKNGMLIGMAGGFASDYVLTVTLGYQGDVPLPEFFVWSAITIVPAGIGIGAMVDSWFHHKELHVDYRAPATPPPVTVAPLVRHGATGIHWL